jgi:hypothetical protein
MVGARDVWRILDALLPLIQRNQKREIVADWQPIETVPHREYVETTVAGDLNIKVAKSTVGCWRDSPDGDRLESDFKPTHWRRLSSRPAK